MNHHIGHDPHYYVVKECPKLPHVMTLLTDEEAAQENYRPATAAEVEAYTVWWNLYLDLEERGIPTDEAEARADKAVERALQDL